MSNPAPGFERNPDHKINIVPDDRRVRVMFGGEVIAETTSARFLHEADYPAVPYIPLEDVRADLLERTAHGSTCPFKGEASYWSIKVGDTLAENAVWSYEAPYDEVSEITGYAAFYPDKVDAIEIDAA